MSASPTQPLAPPDPPSYPPPQVVEFAEKIRAVLATEFIALFGALIGVWSFHPPELPGDVTGQVTGGLLAICAMIAGFYFAGMVGKKNDSK